MASSLKLLGFKPDDARFKQMKIIYDTCTKMNISPPDEVLEYFHHEEPNEMGVEFFLNHNDEGINPIDYDQGYIIDLNKLDPTIQYLKVGYSY